MTLNCTWWWSSGSGNLETIEDHFLAKLSSNFSYSQISFEIYKHTCAHTHIYIYIYTYVYLYPYIHVVLLRYQREFRLRWEHERGQSCQTQETQFNYPNVYLLLGCRQSPGERKRVWKLIRPRQLDKEKQHILMRKNMSRHRLWIFPGSNVLVRWVTSSLTSFLDPSPQKKIRCHTLSTPYIFVASVQLYVFTLSCLALSSQKNTSRPLTFTFCVGCRNIHFSRFYIYVKGFEHQVFFLSFLITTRALALQFLYFLNSISVFMNCSITLNMYPIGI